MKNTFVAKLVLLFIVLAAACVSQQKAIIDIGRTTIDAEIASTPIEWERGLMYRSSLPEGHGMLFVFPDENYRRFWMKNMQIPLDIIFVSANLTVVDIWKNAQPCITSCESYTSNKKVQYVVEVNANFTTEKNIVTGSDIKIIKQK